MTGRAWISWSRSRRGVRGADGQQAVERRPDSGVSESFGHPYAEVYAAVKTVMRGRP